MSERREARTELLGIDRIPESNATVERRARELLAVRTESDAENLSGTYMRQQKKNVTDKNRRKANIGIVHQRVLGDGVAAKDIPDLDGVIP